MAAIIPVGDLLSPIQLWDLRTGYFGNKKKFLDTVAAVLPAKYSLAQDYIAAVSKAFYAGQGGGLNDADRERCIISLLAARDADFNLALHMYLGLMEGVSADEIANILLLTAIYAGVESFSDGLNVEMLLLTFLANRVTTGAALDGVSILTALTKDAATIGIRPY